MHYRQTSIVKKSLDILLPFLELYIPKIFSRMKWSTSRSERSAIRGQSPCSAMHYTTRVSLQLPLQNYTAVMPTSPRGEPKRTGFVARRSVYNRGTGYDFPWTGVELYSDPYCRPTAVGVALRYPAGYDFPLFGEALPPAGYDFDPLGVALRP